MGDFDLNILSSSDDGNDDDLRGTDEHLAGQDIVDEMDGPAHNRRKPPPIPIDTHLLHQQDDADLQIFEEHNDDRPAQPATNKEEEEERIRTTMYHLFTNGNQGRGFSLGDIDRILNVVQGLYQAADGPNKARLTLKSKEEYSKYTNQLLDISEDGWNTVTITVNEQEVSALKGHEPVIFDFHFKNVEQWLKEEYGNTAYQRDFALNHVKRKGRNGVR